MQVGFVCCDGAKRPYAECIQHAGEHQCQWTAALLTAMAGNVREQKGTGLGLAIVRQVVSDHHGQVRAEPNLPLGTKIVIDLPLASS